MSDSCASCGHLFVHHVLTADRNSVYYTRCGGSIECQCRLFVPKRTVRVSQPVFHVALMRRAMEALEQAYPRSAYTVSRSLDETALAMEIRTALASLDAVERAERDVLAKAREYVAIQSADFADEERHERGDQLEAARYRLFDAARFLAAADAVVDALRKDKETDDD